MRGIFLLALMSVLLGAGGCSVLGRSPATHFYMLSSQGAAPSAEILKTSGPRVAVGPVTIPGYLDRPQIFLRDGESVSVALADFQQWSEPMAEGVSRVLCETISAQLAPRHGLAFPLRAPLHPKWRLSVDITRLDGSLGGVATLEAGWVLTDDGGTEVRSGRFALQRATADASMDALIRVESELLVAFGARLGEMIP